MTQALQSECSKQSRMNFSEEAHEQSSFTLLMVIYQKLGYLDLNLPGSIGVR